MRPLTTTLSGLALAALTAITPAMAQNPQADYATCDAYARQTVQPYLNQANAQGVGSALVGAGLGAALGAAIGGGRGAGIGAASGAVGGTMVGASNSAYASADIQNMYNSYFPAACSRAGRLTAPRPTVPRPTPRRPTSSPIRPITDIRANTRSERFVSTSGLAGGDMQKGGATESVAPDGSPQPGVDNRLREERPDLDQVYMAAVQAMTGGGGWPMSVFLTPDGRPFYGGRTSQTSLGTGCRRSGRSSKAWRGRGARTGQASRRRAASSWRASSRATAWLPGRAIRRRRCWTRPLPRSRRGSTRQMAAGAARRSSRSR